MWNTISTEKKVIWNRFSCVLLLLCDGKNAPTKKRTNGNVRQRQFSFCSLWCLPFATLIHTDSCEKMHSPYVLCIYTDSTQANRNMYGSIGCFVPFVWAEETGFRALHIYPLRGEKITYKRKYITNSRSNVYIESSTNALIRHVDVLSVQWNDT